MAAEQSIEFCQHANPEPFSSGTKHTEQCETSFLPSVAFHHHSKRFPVVLSYSYICEFSSARVTHLFWKLLAEHYTVLISTC